MRKRICILYARVQYTYTGYCPQYLLSRFKEKSLRLAELKRHTPSLLVYSQLYLYYFYMLFIIRNAPMDY